MELLLLQGIQSRERTFSILIIGLQLLTYYLLYTLVGTLHNLTGLELN